MNDRALSGFRNIYKGLLFKAGITAAALVLLPVCRVILLMMNISPEKMDELPFYQAYFMFSASCILLAIIITNNGLICTQHLSKSLHLANLFYVALIAVYILQIFERFLSGIIPALRDVGDVTPLPQRILISARTLMELLSLCYLQQGLRAVWLTYRGETKTAHHLQIAFIVYLTAKSVYLISYVLENVLPEALYAVLNVSGTLVSVPAFIYTIIFARKLADRLQKLTS